MNNEIKNRTEAYLSWLATGIQPEGWDLEQPRNKQEYWLSGEAERLDRIERENGGDVETGRKAALRSSNEGTYDYNALDNIPILPMPTDERVEEGQFYYQLGSSEIDFDHRTYTNLQAIPIPSGATSGLYIDTRCNIEEVVGALEEMASHTEPAFDEDDALMYSVIQMSTSDPSYVLEVPLMAVKSKTTAVWMLAVVGMFPIFASSDVEFPTSGTTVTLPAGWNSINPQTGEVANVEELLFEQGLVGVFSSLAGYTAYTKGLEVCDLLLGINPPTQQKEAIGQIVNEEFVPLAVGNDEPVASKLVQHNIKLGHQTYVDNTKGYITICNDSTATFDFASLKAFLDNYATSEGYYPDNTYYPASGLYNGNRIYGVLTIKSKNQIRIQCGNGMDEPVSESDLIITDNVVEIL